MGDCEVAFAIAIQIGDSHRDGEVPAGVDVAGAVERPIGPIPAGPGNRTADVSRNRAAGFTDRGLIGTFVIARSGWPSAFKSPTAIAVGTLPLRFPPLTVRGAVEAGRKRSVAASQEYRDGVLLTVDHGDIEAAVAVEIRGRDRREPSANPRQVTR